MNDVQLELCQLEQMKREANLLLERKTRFKYPLRKQPTFSANANHCRKASKQSHQPPLRSYSARETERILKESPTKEMEYETLSRQRSAQSAHISNNSIANEEPLSKRSTTKDSWRPKRILSVPFGRILSETTELTVSVTQAIAQSANIPITTPPPSMRRYLSKAQSDSDNDESLQAASYNNPESPTSGCVFFLGLADTQSSDLSNNLDQETTFLSHTFPEEDDEETAVNAISQSFLSDYPGEDTLDEDELESIAF